jgi:DNA-directed RNA polymerase alpha subunit
MGIGTLGELAQKTEWDMLGYPNLGRKSLAELADVLEKYDLGFGMKPEKLLQETNIAKKTYVMKKENLERIQHLKKSLLNNILGKKLGDFELPKNFIYFYKNKTLGEIARKTEQEMLQEPLIGKAHMRTIGGLLKKYGLEFGMKIQD